MGNEAMHHVSANHSFTFDMWTGIHALRSRDRIALIDGDTGEQTTFGELERRTNAAARHLRAQGVRPGDRVALLTLNSPQMLEILVGIAKAGAVSVPMNTRLAAPELAYILSDSGATLLFASTDLLPVAQEAARDTAVEQVVVVATADERARGVANDYRDAVAAESEDAVEAVNDLGDVAMIMYTSGTTGRPKGAMLTHGNTLWNAIQHNASGVGLSQSDVSLAVAPLFHIGALGVYTLPLLYWGGTNIITERFDPVQWGRLVEEHQVTKAFAVPTMWSAIVRAGVPQQFRLSSVNEAKSGGAPCPLPVLDELREAGLRFSEGFGMTETAPIASGMTPEDAEEHSGSIGRPAMHMSFRIVDPDGRDVPQGEVGELIMSGPQVFAGYWNKPEATAEAFRDGWFYSGDMARVDEDGFYTLVDRKKDMIISGGENVYPVEVEQVLIRHPGVLDVSVIGVPHSHWGEAVTAIVVVDGTDEPGDELASALDERARRELAGFKVPKSYRFRAELPRTATGKVQKNVLRDSYAGSSGQVHR
ncbi:acyl-CoA synthetase [Brevibacterium yomogidense]|uniref:acyl-CoA synthetase n=1 Tax=Brevibacterium yomogidense TaxID=946573 RepID=UPI001E5C8176|nr:long-chain fatty acid--CoA ligase [Brevibacterium yomogidense]